MSGYDSQYETFQHYGTDAERLAFTPNPAPNIQPLYTWFATDTGAWWVWDPSSPSDWLQVYPTGVAAILTSDPSSPSDDTWWVVRDSASPQSVAMRVRVAGVTYTLSEISI